MKKKYIPFFVLAFSFCELSVNAQTTNVNSSEAVKTDSVSKDNLVDYGLRTEKSWRSTGATYTISGAELEHMTQSNFLNTLQGRIPGLTVVTGSGEPGYDNPTLYVRGNTSWNSTPVVVYLDGFQVDISTLSSLSAHEIETITLLKDAGSLSMFGLEGGGGVLSIKTKTGAVMPKVQITGDARYGIMSPINLPPVSDAYDYVTAYNKATANDNLPTKYPNPELYKATNDPFHPNVNWYDQVLKKTSSIEDYNFSFRGGNDLAKFFVLMNYNSFEGLYKNADIIDKDFGTNAKYQKINLRANVDLKLNKNLTVTANVGASVEDRYTPAGFTAGGLFNFLQEIPAAAFPVKLPDGVSWGNNSAYGFNPVQILQTFGIYGSQTRTLQTNVKFVQKLDKIVKGLDLRGEIGFVNQYIFITQKIFSTPSYEITKNALDQPDTTGGKLAVKQIGSIGQSSSNGGGNFFTRTNIRLGFDYNRTFGKSTFTGVLLGTRQDYNYSGARYDVREQALTGNVTYDYNKTYIISGSAAYNGSGDYAPGHRYGFFPSIGLGWIASNESFLKDNSVINYLKFRASYGSSGNTNQSSRFLYLQLSQSLSNNWITGTNNGTHTGYTTGPVANIDAAWERRTTLNIGADITFLNDFTASLDVFKEKRTGILEYPTADIPSYAGFILQLQNTGEVNNKGFEVELNYKKKVGDFQYYLGGSMAYAHNEVIKESENPQPFSYLYNKGYRLDQVRGLVNTGFYQEADFNADGSLKEGVIKSSYADVHPGDLKYADQNNDGVINAYDFVPLKYGHLPEITLGFNLGFKYKGFDFDAYLQGALNRTINLVADNPIYVEPFVVGNNITPFSNNPWTPATATTATSPRLSTLASNNNYLPSTFWLRSGNFFKVRSLEVGYTLPQTGFLRKMDAVRIFVNGTNLFTWDKLKDLEAEDFSEGYPLTKVISFGVKVKL